jgi:hypothetical protein
MARLARRSATPLALVALAALATTGLAAAEKPAATPKQLVDTYDSLADMLLAAKRTEFNVVHAILATTWGHAQGALAEAKATIDAKRDAGPAVERLAQLVAQLGNEGDAAVAAIRKRLLEGGHHHHHADASKTPVYDDGFVIVTREAKKVFLDASKRIAQLGSSATAAGLDAEWSKVAKQFEALHEGRR